MDCRKPLVLAASLLAGAAGCSHHAATVPGGAPGTSQAAAPPAAGQPARLAANGVKQHRPESWVAYANYAAQEAAAPDRGPAQAQGIRDTARKAYQEALRLDPNCVTAHRGLARLYLAMEDQEHAVAAYQKALNVAPKDASLWFELGDSYRRAKAWGPAVESLSQAVELDSENRQYVNWLGFTLAQAGRYQDSLACLSRHGGEAKGHYQLARMLEHMKQADLCKAHLRMALEKNPNLADARQMLARLEGKPTPQAGAVAAAPAPAEGGIQTVGYVEAKPAPAEPVPGAVPQVVVPASRPAARVLLPPPPSVQIRYQAPAPARQPAKADGGEGKKE